MFKVEIKVLPKLALSKDIYEITERGSEAENKALLWAKSVAFICENKTSQNTAMNNEWRQRLNSGLSWLPRFIIIQ